MHTHTCTHTTHTQTHTHTYTHHTHTTQNTHTPHKTHTHTHTQPTRTKLKTFSPPPHAPPSPSPSSQPTWRLRSENLAPQIPSCRSSCFPEHKETHLASHEAITTTRVCGTIPGFIPLQHAKSQRRLFGAWAACGIQTRYISGHSKDAQRCTNPMDSNAMACCHRNGLFVKDADHSFISVSHARISVLET